MVELLRILLCDKVLNDDDLNYDVMNIGLIIHLAFLIFQSLHPFPCFLHVEFGVSCPFSLQPPLLFVN